MGTAFADDDPGFDGQFATAPESVNPYQSPTYTGDQYYTEHKQPANQSVSWILFSFEGRIPRRVYWGATLGTCFTFYVALFSLFAVFGDESAVTGLGIMALYVPLIWISLAVSVKRWHDRNKSGWWVLIGFVPIVGPIWQFVEVGCLRGTINHNQYGPDPT